MTRLDSDSAVRETPRWPTRLVVIGIVLGLAVATTIFLITPVNGNIRYELGVKFASTYSPAETFSHRPLIFRLLLAAMSQPASALSFGVTSFEFVLRVIALLLAAAAGLASWWGLRRWGVGSAALIALVAVAATVFMGTNLSLEPDWMAVVFAIAGTGVALIGRERLPWLWATVAGALLVASAGMKVISVTTALIGLIVVLAFDRRQAIRTTIASAVIGLLYVGATALWAPYEIQWLIDIQTLTPSVTQRLVSDGPTFLLESVARWPAILLLPAALLLLGRVERWCLAAAVLLAAVPIVLQAQYFGYHGATLCVVAAIAALRALTGRVSAAVGVGIGALVLQTSLLFLVPELWRGRSVWILGVIALFALLCWTGWAVRLAVANPRIADHREVVTTNPAPAAGTTIATTLTTTVAALALLVPAATPFAASLIRTTTTGGLRVVDLTAADPRETAAKQIHAKIGGSDVHVTYLTFGYWPYYLKNPTSCRYPSPLFLQRTRYTTEQVQTPSYAENFACLSEPSARWLILDPAWFPLKQTPEAVQAEIGRVWDCRARFTIDGLEICPRRD